MKRIKGQVPDQIEIAMQVLAWITCATKQLTTIELQAALTVEVGELDLDKENLPDLVDMVSACAGLVTVDEQSNIIRLLHYTAQEYFERNQSTWFSKAHDEFGSICVTYLSFHVFKTGHCLTPKELKMRLRQYPLGPYAASWGHHLRASWGDDLHAPTPDDSSSKSEKAIIELMRDPLKLNSCMQFLCKLDSSSGDRFYPIPSLRHVDSSFYQAEQPFLTTGLHIAAYFGLPNIAQRFISLGTLVDSNDAVQETTLCWAAQHGRDNLVRLLIENGANPNHKDWLGYTPLHFAALNDCDEIARLILDNGGDPMCDDAQVYLPLHVAVMTESEKVARLLLQRGVHPHARNFEGHTPLWLACIFGHEAMATLLLDWDADIQPKAVDLNACLSTAVEYGYETLVQLFLDKGADIDVTDYKGRTPLMLALLAGRESVIKLLLRWDIDLEIKDEEGRNALSLAAELGHRDAVRQFLEKGADPNSYDIDGRTVVFLAACQQDATVLTLLLSSGISTFERDQYGRTPLHVAATRGHSEGFRALLVAGIDCEVQDNFGRTALSDALTRGRNDVAKIIRAFSLKDPIAMDELACRIAQLTDVPRGVSCDICCARILIGESFYSCRLCNGGDFDICELCHHVGARCLDSTHNLEQLQERKSLQIRPRIQLLQLTSPKCRPKSRSWIEEASLFRESLDG
jgi:ankyrin repeat protein